MATREKRNGKPSQEVAGAVPGQLEALRQLAAEKRPDLLPLDLTYESLDRVEDLFRDIIEGKASGTPLDSTEPLVAAYLGQTPD